MSPSHEQQSDMASRFTLLACVGALFAGAAAAVPPATFVFGDSLVDAGNNNYIVTLSRANYAPNGIDFDGHQPTGRYTNGRTIVDILGDKHFASEFYCHAASVLFFFVNTTGDDLSLRCLCSLFKEKTLARFQGKRWGWEGLCRPTWTQTPPATSCSEASTTRPAAAAYSTRPGASSSVYSLNCSLFVWRSFLFPLFINMSRVS
jgi:hypothetical protein